MRLSDRIRPDVEAAPWVIAEVKQLEQQLAELAAQNARLREAQPAALREIEARVLDAERYRYLREIAHPDDDFGLWVAKEGTNSWGKSFSSHESGNNLDEAIDAAMAAAKREQTA